MNKKKLTGNNVSYVLFFIVCFFFSYKNDEFKKTKQQTSAKRYDDKHEFPDRDISHAFTVAKQC